MIYAARSSVTLFMRRSDLAGFLSRDVGEDYYIKYNSLFYVKDGETIEVELHMEIDSDPDEVVDDLGDE